jgi:hypothetical protein
VVFYKNSLKMLLHLQKNKYLKSFCSLEFIKLLKII